MGRKSVLVLLRMPPMNRTQPRGISNDRDRTRRRNAGASDANESGALGHIDVSHGLGGMDDVVTRRHFVKIMSASCLLAGVGLTGCRRPVETIVPFTRLPEGYIHGVSQYYATAMPTRDSAVPLVVRTHEGRPVKIEGNAEHPDQPTTDSQEHHHRGTDRHAQASVLSLYDPDRARRFGRNGENAPRQQALDFLASVSRKFEPIGGKGLHLLMERSSSPSRGRLQSLIRRRLPHAQWHVYEPVDYDVHRQAASLLFGKQVRPVFRLERARRILSLDSDFLAAEENSHRTIHSLAISRRLNSSDQEPSRLYVAESLYSLTGANADHRLSLSPSRLLLLAELTCAEFIAQSITKHRETDTAKLAGELRRRASPLPHSTSQWAKTCVADLVAAGPGSLVLAGYRQPLLVHLIAHALNLWLGSVGRTVEYVEAPARPELSIADLAAELEAGRVDTLVVLGGNPVYTAPADLDWTRAQRKATTVIRLGQYEDETSAVSDWQIPQAHYLESWGDARTGDGTVVPVQPLIEPLFGGLTEIEVLARLGGLTPTNPYEIVRDTFRELCKEGVFEERWRRFLHDGFLVGSASPAVRVGEVDWSILSAALSETENHKTPRAHQIEVVYARDTRVDDGRHANNGWLQELPDPVTKITWDNVIAISPKTAKQLGLQVTDKDGKDLRAPIVRLELNGRAIEGPIWVQPGLADHTVGLALGYGRTAAGRVGTGVGFNAYSLRVSRAPHHATGANLSKTGRTYPLACTQNHASMEGRPIVREANLEVYRANSRFARAMDSDTSRPARSPALYPNPLARMSTSARHQWGMSIDLQACVGCAACVVACQSENNIPIVGREQVRLHREMHWLRVDRYFAGPAENPEMLNQPMLCQHCESAPCESVCPVNATVHNDEGLNVMVYNRCVGTRYCSNNCPFKVRRFNYFDYHRRPLARLNVSPLVSATDGLWDTKRWWHDPDRGSRPEDEWNLLKLVQNPDVTVRMRGVMEKCTFCLQRIEQAKIERKVAAADSNRVEVEDDSFHTACEQACPAGAIVFGNVKSPHSLVAVSKADARSYQVLDHLNLNARVTYLARVRNPNPAMPDYHPRPHSTEEYLKHGGRLEGGFSSVTGTSLKTAGRPGGER